MKISALTINKASEVQYAAAMAEERLSGVAASRRAGAIVHYRPAGPGAISYKYAANSTAITLKRGRASWFLTGVSRDRVYPQQSELLEVHITEAQRDEIVANAVKGFRLISQEQAA